MERCFYDSNGNITHAKISKDDLHLFANGEQISAKNFAFDVNRNF